MLRNPVFTGAESASPDMLAEHRHVLCPHYDTCLDEAIRKDRYFDCRWCDFKKNNIVAYLIHDGTPESPDPSIHEKR